MCSLRLLQEFVYPRFYLSLVLTQHVVSDLHSSSGGEIELQEIVNGLINTQTCHFPGILSKDQNFSNPSIEYATEE
ncbi:hypothetical protein EUGRSUZ_E01203 [Eucalyptus grandis]|uniref:Uncharacterized protein n=2 Tax=Eucalyptus grandis TaxID=71139 RepID=A0ACC3KU72_EUCGR|nr:hypothetical protein EUGRSUZ_E01203 [Eucalyptus grandis]